MGEFDLLARLAPFLSGAGGDLVLGSGDDAAVLKVGGSLVCLTVDVLVEGVHFRRDLSSLADVGWKAVAVNCSDVAAMGAAPSVAVVGLCRPAAVSEEEITELYEGLSAASRHWGLRLVGGDTVSADALALSVTVLGDVGEHGAVPRSGARPGDHLVVVGALGAAATALRQVAAGVTPDPVLLAAHRRPRALVAAGQVLARGGATAMLDVSDGLGADLGHLCEASGVGALVRAADLPVEGGVTRALAALDAGWVEVVCGGGEDFALLAAVPADRAEELAAAAGAAEDVPAAVVGEIVVRRNGPAAVLELDDGSTRDLEGLGWDHFKR